MEAIASLKYEEKLQLLQLLEAEIADAEDLLENDKTIDEYIA